MLFIGENGFLSGIFSMIIEALLKGEGRLCAQIKMILLMTVGIGKIMRERRKQEYADGSLASFHRKFYR